jgi:hypothetical protein
MNRVIKLILGFIGVLSFGAGGAVLFEGLYKLSFNDGKWIGDYAFSNWGFSALLLIGLGLWLIVLCGKLETNQKPS